MVCSSRTRNTFEIRSNRLSITNEQKLSFVVIQCSILCCRVTHGSLSLPLRFRFSFQSQTCKVFKYNIVVLLATTTVVITE